MAKGNYFFPPAVMDESQAAFFCGNLSEAAFKTHIKPYVATVKIGTRRGYLTTSLQAYMNTLAGLPANEAHKPANPLDSLI